MNEDTVKFIKVASEKPENIKVKALVFDLEHKGILDVKELPTYIMTNKLVLILKILY
jgi:hypothetical protein